VKKKVLVVEDEQMQAKLLVNTLLKEDSEVFLCEEGNYAKTILGLNKFDIIFLDINIPNISGLRLLEMIRSNEEHANYNTPVIICTTSDDNGHKIESFKNKANEYFLKPIMPAKIRDTMSYYLS